MNWSQVIWNMYRQEGKTIPEIIKYFDNPVINKHFVWTVLENVKYLKKPPKIRSWNRPYKNKRPPLPGTRARVAWEKVESIGGKDAFLELLKTKTIAQLAREWGIEVFQLTNYKRDFITGRTDEARFRPKIRYEIRNRYNAGLKRRPVKPKDIKNLW